jgi:hypothetical protein
VKLRDKYMLCLIGGAVRRLPSDGASCTTGCRSGEFSAARRVRHRHKVAWGGTWSPRWAVAPSVHIESSVWVGIPTEQPFTCITSICWLKMQLGTHIKHVWIAKGACCKWRYPQPEVSTSSLRPGPAFLFGALRTNTFAPLWFLSNCKWLA